MFHPRVHLVPPPVVRLQVEVVQLDVLGRRADRRAEEEAEDLAQEPLGLLVREVPEGEVVREGAPERHFRGFVGPPDISRLLCYTATTGEETMMIRTADMQQRNDAHYPRPRKRKGRQGGGMDVRLLFVSYCTDRDTVRVFAHCSRKGDTKKPVTYYTCSAARTLKRVRCPYAVEMILLRDREISSKTTGV